MNDQEEILVRQSRWNARRVVLLYWFALIFVGTAAAAGLGSTILSPKYKFETYDHSGITEPWGPQDCLGDEDAGIICHDEEVSEWADTAHSDAVVPYNDTHVLVYGHSIEEEEFYNRSCAACMATRATGVYSPLPGYPPIEYTYWDPMPTCAACHETPGVSANVSVETCGNCHTPFGIYESDIINSSHYQSLDDLLADDDREDSCLHCMAGQGLYADASELTLDNPDLIGITCVTCHDPMSAATGKTQLRADSTVELCGKCHEGAYGMRTGIVEDTVYTPPTGPHAEFDCTVCHGYYFTPPHEDVSYTGATVWYNASFDVNHSWAIPLPDACARCHAPWETDVNITDIETPIQGRLDELEEIQANFTELLDEYNTLLAEVKAKADELSGDKADNVNALIDEAEDIVRFVDDGSKGFHNPALAEEKLQLAIDKLKEAEKEAAPSPGFEWTGVLLAFSVIGGLAILFRKKRR
ncbi:MAG: multiheme c-type cytochrome [Candidatus Hodarchaeota archaeon]